MKTIPACGGAVISSLTVCDVDVCILKSTLLGEKKRPSRGVARIFKRGVTVCHTQGTHQIVMSRVLWYEINLNSKLCNRCFGGQGIENSSNLRLFPYLNNVCRSFETIKVSKRGVTGTPGPPPPRYALAFGIPASIIFGRMTCRKRSCTGLAALTFRRNFAVIFIYLSVTKWRKRSKGIWNRNGFGLEVKINEKLLSRAGPYTIKLKTIYCGDGVPSTFLAVMRCSAIFFFCLRCCRVQKLSEPPDLPLLRALLGILRAHFYVSVIVFWPFEIMLKVLLKHCHRLN